MTFRQSFIEQARTLRQGGDITLRQLCKLLIKVQFDGQQLEQACFQFGLSSGMIQPSASANAIDWSTLIQLIVEFIMSLLAII